MAVTPKAPTTRTRPKIDGVTVEPLRAKFTVEIETMAKGRPKVTIRVDEDDEIAAVVIAVRMYNAAYEQLAATSEEE